MTKTIRQAKKNNCGDTSQAHLYRSSERTFNRQALTSHALSKNWVSATTNIIKFPALTVSSHMLADTAFIDAGDSEYLQSIKQ
jgi:hypothetical protein